MVVSGLPGSGKTTLAKEVATATSAARMCPDDWMMSAGMDLWELDEWWRRYEPPTDEELATYDPTGGIG